MSPVKPGGIYVYRPYGVDQVFTQNIEPGEFVRVIRPPTQGHMCRVVSIKDQSRAFVLERSLLAITWEKKGEKRWPEESNVDNNAAAGHPAEKPRKHKRSSHISG